MKRAERGGDAREHCVLVVDDEPDIRELLELTLVKMGLGVDSVGSIGAAKDRLRDARYQLCLTDMRLPDGGAWSWCAISLRSRPTCRWR